VTPQRWHGGNRVLLLQNGEEFFPRVFAAIGSAQREVFAETFILFDDAVGQQLQQTVIAAARRGLRVELTVDGYGSADLPKDFIEAMTTAGVRFHLFDPRPKTAGMRTNLFRRLHRKLVVADARVAFIGGLNFSRDHLSNAGTNSKQDYAVEVEGPVVSDIHRLAEEMVAPRAQGLARWWRRRHAVPETLPAPAAGGAARVLLATRDSDTHHDDIEAHYRAAIRSARREVILANAYFFPGHRLLRELRNAARRGVAVHLILQGNPDKPSAQWAARTLYDYLLSAGACIHEYTERSLHAKVALVDDDWATVGSSNLDPLSLFLNLEANLVIRDPAFNAELRARLEPLIRRHCVAVPQQRAHDPSLWRQLLRALAFHVLRRMPAWAGWLPGHRLPQLSGGATGTAPPPETVTAWPPPAGLRPEYSDSPHHRPPEHRW